MPAMTKRFNSQSLPSVLAFRKKMFEESMALIEKKGHDYNRQQQNEGDTLYNLKVAALLGIVDTPSQGVLVRLTDKFMRLISLMSPGVKPANVNESVRDTVRDIHNYVDYALQMFEESDYRRNTTGEEDFYPAAGDPELIHEEVPHGSGFGVIRKDEYKVKI